jgi:hypothetical protein
MRRITLAGLAVLALPLAGCFQPTGPIVGDWRGSQQADDPFNYKMTELILDGTPGAMSGQYHLITRLQNQNPQSAREETPLWSDRWEKRIVRTASGVPYTMIHLDHSPGDQLPDYATTDRNLLVPVADPLHPDLSPAAMRTALYPVPKDAFGYGRP